MNHPGSPGSHPDRRNWHSATTAEDYPHNCRDGLETFSERRMARLLDVSRIKLWRCRLMAEIPNDLFELLMAEGCRSSKELANVALALRGDAVSHAVECCPHCKRPLRLQGAWRNSTAKAVNAWADRAPKAGAVP